MGHSTFGGGTIDIDAWIMRPSFGNPHGDSKGSGKSWGSGDGQGGKHRHGHGRSHGDGTSGEPRASAMDGPVPTLHESNAPPKQVHLRITNHRANQTVVQVIDFTSVFGDFAVQPSKIVVPPNSSKDADPMVSRLEAQTDDVPLEVRVVIDGKVETQSLRLRPGIAPTDQTSTPPPKSVTSAGR